VEKLSRERVSIEREHTQELQDMRESHAAHASSLEGDKLAVHEQLEDALVRIKQAKVDGAAQVRASLARA